VRALGAALGGRYVVFMIPRKRFVRFVFCGGP
jgi:hypothetical protein